MSFSLASSHAPVECWQQHNAITPEASAANNWTKVSRDTFVSTV
jgi:hypothetical protein